MFGFFKKKLRYQCACCGKTYSGSPSFAYLKPSYYFDIPENDRDERITIDTDLCHIKGRVEDSSDDIFAIRATLDIPILGMKDPFCWGVWVTQSRENFYRYVETFAEDQSDVVTFGWLAVTMPIYNKCPPDQPHEHLGCDVSWAGEGQRPKIFVQEVDHPLFVDQRDGITRDRAVEIAKSFMRTVHLR
ncbi:DUF2199 domain-containing protein (plasmid) [Asticcacaulis sp. DW145]|uniref:DUF2199 domain-containing protein n=1 Tax=Asticcacaulis sp. DW145 TaxID=3095608 RepID=UPI003086403F|nr:DUF2199 domain-containing protein [Asticcacaulis sp. DW145]